MADADDSAEWRAIEGFPDYEVSDGGRVRRITRPARGPGRNKLIPYDLVPSMDGRGRPGVGLAHSGNASGQKRMVISRLVARAFHGQPPSLRHVVCHNNGDSTDNRACNLRWDTQKENIADKEAHGTMARGSRIGTARVTEADVPKIRAMLAQGYTQQKVAEAFGIDQTTVSLIKNRRFWKHVV